MAGPEIFKKLDPKVPTVPKSLIPVYSKVKPESVKPKQPVWKERLKKVAKIALYIVLAPVALLSGCGGEEVTVPKQPPAAAIPKQIPAPQVPQITTIPKTQNPKPETLYWWPGYIIKNGEITDVSLGFKDVYYLDKTYTSSNSVPQQVRDANKPSLKKALDFSSFFFEKAVFDDVSINNVFVFPRQDWEASGGYNSGLMGYRMADIKGQTMATCFEKCPTYDEVVMKPGAEKVLFHELLHDVWDTKLSAETKNAFAARSRLFFNAVGDTAQAEELIGAIWNGVYHSGSVANTKDLSFKGLLPNELNNWAIEKLASSGLASTDVDKIKKSISAYLQIRSSITFGRTFGYTQSERDTFIVEEGFAFFGANYPVLEELYNSAPPTNIRFIPGFMKLDYSGVIKAENLNHMMYLGYGYFTTEDNFKAFIPYIDSFVNWMKNKYPELGLAGQ